MGSLYFPERAHCMKMRRWSQAMSEHTHEPIGNLFLAYSAAGSVARFWL